MRDRLEGASDQPRKAPRRLARDPRALARVGDAAGRGEIGARGKRRTGASDDQDASLAIVAHLMDQAFELQDDGVVQRVALFGAIECDRRDGGVFFKGEICRHLFSPRGFSRGPDASAARDWPR